MCDLVRYGEGTVLLHGRFVVFNAAYLCRRRACMQKAGELRKLFFRARCDDLYRTIVQVTDCACK